MAERFLPVILVLAVAIAFAAVFLLLSGWLGPKRPDPLKESTYECGIPPRSSTRIRFFIRFFLVALLFLLFDLEAVFLYPWVLLYRAFLEQGRALFALAELGVFVAVLAVGFVWVWKKGGLEWQ